MGDQVLCENAICNAIARHDMRLRTGEVVSLCREHADYARSMGATYEEDGAA